MHYFYWSDKLVADLPRDQQHVINDSKTPSGRIHIGALRGPLIHDLVYRSCLDANVEASFLFGSDDLDPLDNVPPYLNSEVYRPYLGMPLRYVPSPNANTSYSDYFMSDLLYAMQYVGIQAKPYRIGDYYVSGSFDEAIDLILRNADTVREIYKRVSDSDRPDGWLPIHPICESCGRIATTTAIAYDGKEITYQCSFDRVNYAKGCGHKGSRSPFGGRAKLPWKLEWAARWAVLGVTIEGAGKDHIVAGGSRHVAARVLDEVFHRTPPLNIPYEWLLAGGQGMSTSMGVGYSVRHVADNMLPELLRFSLVRQKPMKAIEFEMEGMAIPRLFDDYDACVDDSADSTESNDNAEPHLRQRIIELSQISANLQIPQRRLRFTEVITLVQIPHVNVSQRAEEQLGHLSELEQADIRRRADYAEAWLKSGFAPDHVRFTLHETLPTVARGLSDKQRQFLGSLAQHLEKLEHWSGEYVHNLIYDVSKQITLTSKKAFSAIYLSFAGQEFGPRAGNLLANLDRDFVLTRLCQASDLG